MLMNANLGQPSPAPSRGNAVCNLIPIFAIIVVVSLVACSSSTPSVANSPEVSDSEEPWVEEYQSLYGDDYGTPLATYENLMAETLGLDWRDKLRATWEAEEREQETWLATRDAEIEATRVIVEATVEVKAAAIRGETRAIRAIAWDEMIASLPDAEIAVMLDTPSCRRLLDTLRYQVVERGYTGDVSLITDPDDDSDCTQALNDHGVSRRTP